MAKSFADEPLQRLGLCTVKIEYYRITLATFASYVWHRAPHSPAVRGCGAFLRSSLER